MLAVVFAAAPQAVGAAFPDLPPAYVVAVQQAALVPTCVMLVSFIVNVSLLLAAFLAAGATVRELRGMHATVLRWQVATAAVLADAAARRGAPRSPAVAGLDRRPGDEPPRRDPDVEMGELAAVTESQRALLTFLSSAIEDDGGLRFLGVFRPGAASVGGIVAVMVSATALGVRLAATVYNTAPT